MEEIKATNSEEVPINVVGSSIFGRYPKISLEKTYNMFISDGWLVNYAGFQNVVEILASGEGRGLFHSIRGNIAVAVISSRVYVLDSSLSTTFVGNLDSQSGEVSIDENLTSQIAICDNQFLYIYNYVGHTFTKQTLNYTPAVGSPYVIKPDYVSYHNGSFLLGSNPSSDTPQLWYVARFASATTVAVATEDAFPIQTKPDFALAVVRLPGKGNNVIVFGSAVAEVWTQVGGVENYRRIQSFNIDVGCTNRFTIAANEEFVAWLGQNQNNAPCIMVTDGTTVKRISTDGIDYLLQSLAFPEQSTAFFYRQDGHLFYQITFFHQKDNLSLIYDFSTSQFFHVSDQRLDYHPARQVIFFNKKSYFISLNDGSLYQTSTDFISYNYSTDTHAQGDEIPRIRICKSVRRNDNSRFRCAFFTFWLEQGVNDYFANINDIFCTGMLITEQDEFIITEDGEDILDETGECLTSFNGPRVDMSFSKNGNQSFSNIVSRFLNPKGVYRNRISWNRMGMCNEFTVQLRFWGFQRFVAMDGVLETTS